MLRLLALVVLAVALVYYLRAFFSFEYVVGASLISSAGYLTG